MTEIPEMPDDFWPEMLVTGKHEGNELGFALTQKIAKSGNLEMLIDALRLSFWQAHHLGIKP